VNETWNEAPVEDTQSPVEGEGEWFVPPPEAYDKLSTGFSWTPSDDAKLEKTLHPSARDVRSEDLTESDYYEASIWWEQVDLISYEAKHVRTTDEERKLLRDQVILTFMPTPGVKSKNAGKKLNAFSDFWWGTSLMSDGQLKAFGANKRPLIGRLKQTQGSIRLLEQIMKATGHSDKLSNGHLTGGLGQVPFADLVNRSFLIQVKNEKDQNDEDQTRVRRVKPLKKD
jgi:hypothetical protein